MVKISFSVLGRLGQLGNQMFQYSLLLGIKNYLNSEIIIDYETKKNSYLFDFFNLKEYKIEDYKFYKTYNEYRFDYDPNVFKINSDTNFHGYFQTEKYFIHCSDVVRREFKFKEEVRQNILYFLKNFEGKKIVSLHVRRGDYLSKPHYHSILSVKYYEDAMNMLDDGNSVFICVSNDISWCKENLVRENLFYYEGDLIHDMCLISNCSHHIIANSSFSWWGSWLCENPNKIIISPKNWFGPAASHLDTKDIYCDNFIKL